MHLFLSGETQVGKSTAIRRFISEKSWRLGGFLTVWDRKSQQLFLHLLGGGEEKIFRIAAFQDGRLRPDTDAFNAAGQLLLDGFSDGADLFLMDEIGFLERNALIFQRAVLSVLDSPAPILGVIRLNKQTDFLNQVRSHPSVQFLPVTLQNRDSIPGELARRFGEELP